MQRKRRPLPKKLLELGYTYDETIYAHKYTEDGKVMEDIKISRVFSDEKLGEIFRVDAARHYFHFRMTPTGLLRHGPINRLGVDEGIINGG